MLHGLVYLSCFATILQQVAGTPFACLRVAERVMLTGLHQLLCWGQRALPLAFLTSIIVVDAAAATVVLTRAGLPTLVVLSAAVAFVLTGGFIARRY